LTVLVFEPDDARFARLADLLGRLDMLVGQVDRAQTHEAAMTATRFGGADVCLCPSRQGPDEGSALTLAIAEAVAAGRAAFVPVVAIVDGDADAGAEALQREGAADYVLWSHLFESQDDAAGAAELQRALLVADARRKAVRALHHERRLADMALDEAGLVAAVLDARGRVVRLSWAAEDAAGQTSGDAFGQPFWALFANKPEADTMRERLAACGARLTPLWFESAWTGATGRRQDLTWSVTPEIDAQDAVERLVVVGRSRQEPAYETDGSREAERMLLRHVVASAPIMLYAIDLDGRILLSEGDALSRIGLRPGEVVGRHVQDVYADQPDVLAVTKRALSGESLEATMDLHGRTLHTRYTPLVIDGVRRGALGISTDVTEQRDAERALRRVKQAVESASDAVAVCDPTGRVVYGNPALQEMLGGEDLEQCFEIDAIWSEVVAAAEEGHAWQGEVAIRAAGGHTMLAALRADPLAGEPAQSDGGASTDEAPAGFVAVFSDLTALMKAQRNQGEGAARLERTLRSAGLVHWTHDARTGALRWSPSAADVLGLDVPALLPTWDALAQHLHPDQRAALDADTFDLAVPLQDGGDAIRVRGDRRAGIAERHRST
jgi:PAS domain S-box-containing protein